MSNQYQQFFFFATTAVDAFITIKVMMDVVMAVFTFFSFFFMSKIYVVIYFVAGAVLCRRAGAQESRSC